MIRFTANQLILLLQIYRGSFGEEAHPGTLNNDLVFLRREGFIKESERKSYDVTTAGGFYIKTKILGESP